jgi:polyhydroxyalkanoate synthase
MNASPTSPDMKKMEENLRTLERVLTTPYPIAQTPKEVVWTLNKAKLYRYVPAVPPEQRYRVPLLLVFALINRAAILDLRPGNSFVEYMVAQGYDVYLLDWGYPGPEDQNMRFDDYVLEYLPRAVRKVKAISGSEEFSILGWCMGAIITSMYASLRPNDGLRNLILLTAPLDFTDKQCGGFVQWVNNEYFDVEKLILAYGNMPGDLIDYGAKALKPVENYVQTYMRLWDNLDNPKVVESWHAMNTWVRDLVPMAGAAFRQLIVNLYRENRLVEGTMKLRGETVNLANVKANLLVVEANEDHIVPPCETEGAFPLFGSEDKELIKSPGGHIGIMAGSGARKQMWPTIESWLASRSGKKGK